jgi:uncharacterized protein (DUF58 family)
VKFIRSLYLRSRLFYAAGILIAAFIVCFIFEAWIIIPKILFAAALAIALADLLLLYRTKKGLNGHRFAPEKLSNGDENEIRLYLENFYPFTTTINIIDEIPHQFQVRDINFKVTLEGGKSKTYRYTLRPVKRGEYDFGSMNVYATSPIGFFSRRFIFSANKMVPVYPSFIQMRKFELLAISNQLTEVGVKRIRKIGQNTEFELIKDYVAGDDFRVINWKASARKNQLMVNQYQDERSQQVYCLIDKGRVMQMPFNGLSLLDYAINASLVISNIAMKKSDKAGIVTFQDKIGTVLPASRSNNQMNQILEVLYKQKTGYRESDFSILYSQIRRKITQRSLLLLFTNFESIYGMQRELPFLRSLAHQHLVVVIFFENTEMKSLIHDPASDLRTVYHKAIAEKFSYEKKLIVKELNKNGIQSILTAPENLTVNTINKYLELKARGMI